MDTLYLVDVSVTLKPVYHADPPKIRVGMNDFLSPHTLTQTTTYNWKFYSRTACTLQVEFTNKQPGDTVMETNLDKAVIVESVSFFGISDPKFVWAGVYQPENQRQLCPHTYLSWNGIWTLHFDVPVFSWMHQVQGLGWIYQ